MFYLFLNLSLTQSNTIKNLQLEKQTKTFLFVLAHEK